jgi:hypothetical protein
MSKEILQNSLRKLKSTQATHYERISDFEQELAITASPPQKFELYKLINESKKKIQELDQPIKDIEQQLKDIEVRQNNSRSYRNPVPDREDLSTHTILISNNVHLLVTLDVKLDQQSNKIDPQFHFRINYPPQGTYRFDFYIENDNGYSELKRSKEVIISPNRKYWRYRYHWKAADCYDPPFYLRIVSPIESKRIRFC